LLIQCKRYRVICCLVLSFLFACALVNGASARTVVNHFNNTAHGLGWLSWLQEQVPRFEAENPDIKIELTTPTTGGNAEQFMVFVASGVSIDVSELVVRMGASVAALGGYKDLRPYLQRSKKVSFDSYVPIARSAVTRLDGLVWGLPVDLYVVPTHYHADMFAEGGLATPAELGEEWNFDAAVATAKRLTIDRSGDGVPEQWGTHRAFTFWVYGNAFENRDAKMFDRNVEPTRSLLNTPKVAQAFQWMVDLHLVHNVADISGGVYSAEFRKGKYAWSMGAGPNAAQGMVQANATFRWGVALPIGGEKRGAYTAVGSLQIPVASQNSDAAWRWMEFLASSADSWTSFIANTSRLPASQRQMNQWVKHIQRMPNPPEAIDNYIQAAIRPDNYVPVSSPHYSRFETLSLSLVTQVLRGQRDPGSVLEELHQHMTALFNETK
jgi:multiple sugar transport system substrate-binding protein